MSRARYDVVVAGAGLSGLTAAAYLSKNGFSVLLVEKTGGCGGLLNSFSRDGFVFDAGAKSIENAGVVRPLLKDLGIELELLPSPVSIGIEERVISMRDPDGIATYRNLLAQLYPGNQKEIERIILVIKKVMKEMHVLYGHDNPVFRDFLRDRAYLFGELLPWFGRFLMALRRLRRLTEPVEQYLARLSSVQSLNDILSQHFFKKTPIFFALGYFYVYTDYLYPKGGTGKFPEKLAASIVANGGQILYHTAIQRIHAARRTLEGTNGLDCAYDTLIWCADQKFLYSITDTADLNSKQLRKISLRKQQVMASRGGDSVFSLYLGLDMPAEKFAGLTNGHLFYTPLKDGLGETHRGELSALLDSENPDNRGDILAWLRKYCRLTTYEISIPSLRDSDLSPPGKTGMVVSFLFEYDLVKKVIGQGWYEDFKTEVENAMIAALDTTVFPGIKDKICLRFSSTPSTIESLFGNSEGGITGWTFERPSPVFSTILKIPQSVKTPFPGILQAGQWAYSPAGIPTAILTGWYAYNAAKRKTKHILDRGA